MTVTRPDYALDDAMLLASCREERCRSSGPGGQHAQKTDTAVRLVHVASGIEARCQDHRERLRNRESALLRLRLRLALDPRFRAQADPAWAHQRLRGRQLSVSPLSAQYPLVVAVLCDALAATQWSFAEAAARVGCSTSQLLKVLGADAETRQAVETGRRALGLSPPQWR